MIFSTVQNNARSRLNENLQYLNYIESIEPTDPHIPIPLEVNIMKGLFYVHLYSSLEKLFNQLIEHALSLINAKSISTKHYTPSFLMIALNNQLKSFKMCSNKNYINKAYSIFMDSNLNTTSEISETTFSESLQNVWFKTIEEVCQCFGITIHSTPRLRATINELVDNRNAVAHGRENAADIGSRFRTSQIRLKFNEVSNFCYLLINLFESCLTNKKYLKPAAKRYYT